MVAVPAVIFYIAVIAMVVVCTLLAVLLFYIIKVAKIAHGIAMLVDEESRRVGAGLQYMRRAVRLLGALFWRGE